jgi:hypothetical protein
MKQSPEELNDELMNNLKGFTEDIGVHLPPDKIESTTTSLIHLFISYEKYKESIMDRGRKVLEKGFGELPIEIEQRIQSKIKERYENKLLTKYEVMDYLNISRRHFEKLVTEENLSIIKITQNKRYMRLSDLNRYLNTKMIKKPQETTQEVQHENDFQWRNIWGK